MEDTGYRAHMAALQTPDKYVEVVSALRKSKDLHPLVEMRLTELLRTLDPTLHVHPEKYGISNGRIDVGCYVPGRAVMHLELIASASGGHVFRDTTSLLGSNADTRAAILIDEDVDREIIQHYTKAIPGNEIARIPLRTILLEEHATQALDIFRGMCAEARFRAGDTAPGGFSCIAEPREFSHGQLVDLRIAGITAAQSMHIFLRSPEQDALLVAVLQIEPAQDACQIRVPNSPALRKGRCRLEAVLLDGRKAASQVFIQSQLAYPTLVTEKERYRVGDEVTVTLTGFPTGDAIDIMLWHSTSGGSMAQVTPDRSGTGTGKFTLPAILLSQRLGPGYHKLAATHGYLHAETFIFVEVAEAPPSILLHRGQTSAQRTGDISMKMSEVEILDGTLRVHAEMMVFSSGLSVGSWYAQIYRQVDGQTRAGILDLLPEDPRCGVSSIPLAPRIVYPFTLRFVIDRRYLRSAAADLVDCANYQMSLHCAMYRLGHFDQALVGRSLSKDEVVAIVERAS